MGTGLDSEIFGRQNLYTNKSSSTPVVLGIDLLSNKHQITLQCYESTRQATPINPTSGVVTVSYRPYGSTSYIAMADTIDLTSGPRTKLFSGIYDSLQFAHTIGHATTALVIQARYSAWSE